MTMEIKCRSLENPRLVPSIQTLGRAYKQGKLSVSEVARELELDIPDVVALLEEGGYARTLEENCLREQEQEVKLAKIRQDRLQRNGSLVPVSPEKVRRSVLATQRLEGIDARPWLPKIPA